MLLIIFTYSNEASCATAHEHRTLGKCNNTCICIVGTVDGRGYSGQQNYTICDACRLCHLILRTLKSVFDRFIELTTHGPESPYLATFVSTTMTTTELIALPLVHGHGVSTCTL